MAEADSRWPLTSETQVESQASLLGIYGDVVTGVGVSPSTSVLPRMCHSTGAPC
jgi:hypothetical protein